MNWFATKYNTYWHLAIGNRHCITTSKICLIDRIRSAHAWEVINIHSCRCCPGATDSWWTDIWGTWGRTWQYLLYNSRHHGVCDAAVRSQCRPHGTTEKRENLGFFWVEQLPIIYQWRCWDSHFIGVLFLVRSILLFTDWFILRDAFL